MSKETMRSGTSGMQRGSTLRHIAIIDSSRGYLSAGQHDHKVFETTLGKGGLLICMFQNSVTLSLMAGWDMSHPMAAQTVADLGADIVFVPTYWLATDSEPYVYSFTYWLTSGSSTIILIIHLMSSTSYLLCA